MKNPQWLRVLYNGMKQLGLPARELVATLGQLSIEFGADRRIVATVRPRSGDTPAFGTTHRYSIAYTGAQDLTPRERAWLSALVRLLRHIEPHLPSDFQQPCGVFASNTPPEARFSRLFPFCALEHSDLGGTASTEVLLRATSRCTHSCPFCSAPSLRSEPSREAVLSCIDQAARLFPSATLTLTGGEPTLRPSFFDELSAALDHFRQVQVQTNAAPFASRIDAGSCPPRTGLHFFVSLHALREELHAELVGVPGQLDDVLAGIRSIHQAGHRLFVNCVVNALNVDHLDDYVDLLPTAVPCDDRLELHFSSLICPEYRPDAARFIVPYTRLVPALERAAARAEKQGLRVSPLRSSTHAAMPPCTLSDESRHHLQRRPRIAEHETGYEDLSRPWVKAQRCRDCVETDTCLGVPRAYARALGLDELRVLARK